MTLKEEIKRAEEKGFAYIPPYKLAEMMKLSSKTVMQIVDNAISQEAGNE